MQYRDSDGHHPALHRLWAYRPAFAGLALLAALIAAAMLAPLLAGGIDRDGDRLVIGPVVAALLQARGSLSFALLAGLLGAVIGIGWAALALALGPRSERAMLRLAARLATAPLPLAVLVASGLLDPGVWLLALLIALGTAPAVAGAAHEGMRALQRREFLVAARAYGAPDAEVTRRHLLPNALWPLVTAGWPALPRALASESFASLLGLGLPAPVGSWGGAVAMAVAERDPVGALVPALLLGATLWALWALADGIRIAGEPAGVRA